MREYKYIQIEGSLFSKIVQIMRHVDYINDTHIMLDMVTAARPDIRIELDADGIELAKDDLLISEHLAAHTHTDSIEHETVNAAEAAFGIKIR